MDNKEIKDKVILFHTLQAEIEELKEAIKGRKTQINDIFGSIKDYLKETGEDTIKTDTGDFSLGSSVKYTKKKV